MKILIENAYFRSGQRPGHLKTTPKILLKDLPADRNRLIVFTWPNCPWFRLKVVDPQMGGKVGAAFTENPSEYAKMLRSTHPSNAPHEEVLNGKLSVFASIFPANQETEIRIAAILNTNTPEFCRLTPVDLGDGLRGLRLMLKVDGYLQGAPDIQDVKDIPIEITPVTLLPRFSGHMSLDFGNTSCTLVRLKKAHDEVSDLEVVEFNPEELNPRIMKPAGIPKVRNIPSTLLVHKLTPPSKQFLMADADCVVGQDFGHPQSVLGAKRMLVDVDQQQLTPLATDHKTFQVPKQLPAELLIARILASYGYARGDKPTAVGKLAITYPSTYSSWEYAQLQKTAYYAVRRALGVLEYFKHDVGMIPPSKDVLRQEQKEKDKKIKQAIPLLIDEASAAAFFYLYKDFIKSPGSIPAMRYLYPKGLRILLYDCGGGTTDVALVKATGEKSQTDDGYRLEIEVLGRTGHRNFGGDKMTEAVFRLLKAKLAGSIYTAVRGAEHLRRIRPKDLVLSGIPEKLVQELDQSDALVNQILPTRFSMNKDEFDELLEEKQLAVRDLWDWAERIKCDLSEKTTYDSSSELEQAKERSQLRNLLTKCYGNDEVDWGEFLASVNLTIQRAEVDQLLLRDIDATIQRMNDLLEKKLGTEHEVDYVYVVGNASRYPLVVERLKKLLKIRFKSERLRFDGIVPETTDKELDFEEDLDEEVQKNQPGNLKNAVAKGACLALLMLKDNLGFHLNFDRELVQRLPCDLVIPQVGENVKAPPLFREGEHCGHLKPQEVPPPPAPPGKERPTEMHLKRRWPGEQQDEPYLEFNFEHEIEGPVKVWYDADRCQFVMQDKNDHKPCYGKQMPVAEYVSPVQSGRL